MPQDIVPQDNIPDWLWIPAMAVAWSAVIYIYVWLPLMADRKKRKQEEEES